MLKVMREVKRVAQRKKVNVTASVIVKYRKYIIMFSNLDGTLC